MHLQFSLLALLGILTAAAIGLAVGPFASLPLLYGVFFVSLARSAKRMPETVASRFDFHNRPNQFLPRGSYLTAMAFIGVFGPLFPTALFMLIMSKKLSPFMVRHVMWLPCLLIAFVLGLHELTVAANRRNPPHFPARSWALMGLLVLGVASWIAALAYHQLH